MHTHTLQSDTCTLTHYNQTHTHTHTYIHTYTFMYTLMHMCTHSHTLIYNFARPCTSICTHVTHVYPCILKICGCQFYNHTCPGMPVHLMGTPGQCRKILLLGWLMPCWGLAMIHAWMMVWLPTVYHLTGTWTVGICFPAWYQVQIPDPINSVL